MTAGLTGLLWGGAVRMFVLHHVTYSINSLCHFFGRQRFDTGDESRNLAWLAPFTFGEAWHNNHHAFPTSAAHGLRRLERSSTPRRGVIWLLEKAGLAWDVVRVSPERMRRKGRPSPACQRRRAAPAPLRDASSTSALPERPSRSSSGTGRRCPRPTARAARPSRVRSPRGARPRCCARPGQLGLGRAYVRGRARGRRPRRRARRCSTTWQPPPLDRARAGAAGARAPCARTGLRLPPRPPDAELRPRGRRHSRERDARAVRHHYDVGNEFFALFLDESMTYSCAIFSRGAQTLEEAQRAKLELVCTQARPAARASACSTSAAAGAASRSTPPQRLRRAGASGITLSEPQAELARGARRGGGRRRPRRRSASPDYRELADEPFDAIASIGMVEHVGASQIDAYAARLARLLKPGGRLLNHGIARLRTRRPRGRPVLRALRVPRRARRCTCRASSSRSSGPAS